MEEIKPEAKLLVGVDEKLPLIQNLALGTQHVLASDLYLAPIVFASLIGLGVGETGQLLSMTFIAAGIATIIQSAWGMKLPVLQGISYIPLGALAAIAKSLGMAAMIGSLIPGALLIFCLGLFKVVGKLVRRFIPPLVGGTVIMLIGISLMPIAINGIFQAPGDKPTNVLIGFVTVFLLAVFHVIGTRLQMVRLLSVLITLVVGTLFAGLLAPIDFSPIGKASWFSLPQVFAFGVPTFEMGAILPLLFIYLIVLIETTGTWFVIGAATGTRIDDQRLNSGTIGEGIGCLVGSVFGGTPFTGYSSNAGVISLTGVASRWAVVAGGVVFILLGMIPKLMAVIACIPGPVIGGVFGLCCVMIVMNGMLVIKQFVLNERNMLVIGIPVFLALAVTLMPFDISGSMPSFFKFLFSSGSAVGALAAVVLNLLIPDRDHEETVTKELEAPAVGT